MEQINGLTTNKGKLNLRIYTRGGSKSPEHWQWFYKGHWVSEYENKKRWQIQIDSVGLFKVLYRGVSMSELIYSPNPFLDLLQKENEMPAVYLPMPIIYGKE